MYVFSSEKQFISATFFIILKLTLECVPLCFLLHLPRSLSNSTSGWVMFPDTCASRCLCPTSCGSTASAWPTGLLWKGKKVIKRLFSVEGMCAARHHSGEVTAKAFFFVIYYESLFKHFFVHFLFSFLSVSERTELSESANQYLMKRRFCAAPLWYIVFYFVTFIRKAHFVAVLHLVCFKSLAA